MLSKRDGRDARALRLQRHREIGVETGAELRRFREARVPLQTIAGRTKIGTRTLDDIETERMDRLPPTVYLRGFVQEYAREIGLDPRDTAERYLARLARRPT